MFCLVKHGMAKRLKDGAQGTKKRQGTEKRKGSPCPPPARRSPAPDNYLTVIVIFSDTTGGLKG